ncbi:hypothetical protein HN587_04315 [Candidatus Woesearchaeota archaeon]|jgi:hypothetical protein|nr:hypothetical protein [Candidatus Woesearchaeota archaeon]
MIQFRRKIYKRGSSFETTIPKPILFALESDKKYEIVFQLDVKTKKWYIELEEAMSKNVKNANGSEMSDKLNKSKKKRKT